MHDALLTIQDVGPVLVTVWAITIALTVLRPQRYFNSFMLMASLLVTAVFVANLFGRDNAGSILLVIYLIAMLGIMLVPLLLVVNGVVLIRREGLCLPHLLSIALGLGVGIGEVAGVVYVLGLNSVGALDSINRLALFVTMTVLYFSVLVLNFVVYTVFMQVMPHRMNFDYVIIHGCGLTADGHPTKLLANRVDKAIEIWQKCQVKPVIIPSGGKGSDELVSEAQAMRDYLVAHGIPEESIVMEDRSTTTRENLSFSKEIIDARGGGRVALVSSNYHVYRCLRYAREVGLRCSGVGAKVALYYWPSALIREFIAVFLSRRFLVWALLGYALLVSPFVYELLR